MTMQEDLGYVDESQDLEALSDEDADDFSNREQRHQSNEFQNTHQSFYEEFHESQHEGQFEGVQEDTAIFARDLGDSDFEIDPIQEIHVGLDQVFPS